MIARATCGEQGLGHTALLERKGIYLVKIYKLKYILAYRKVQAGVLSKGSECRTRPAREIDGGKQ